MLPKRLTWFGLGAVTGAAGVVYGYVRAREATTIEPARVADAVVGAGRRVGGGVRDVVAESRAAVREVEEELRRDSVRHRSAPGAVGAAGSRSLGPRGLPAPEPAAAARARRRRRGGSSAPTRRR